MQVEAGGKQAASRQQAASLDCLGWQPAAHQALICGGEQESRGRREAKFKLREGCNRLFLAVACVHNPAAVGMQQHRRCAAATEPNIPAESGLMHACVWKRQPCPLSALAASSCCRVPCWK